MNLQSKSDDWNWAVLKYMSLDCIANNVQYINQPILANISFRGDCQYICTKMIGSIPDNFDGSLFYEF